MSDITLYPPRNLPASPEDIWGGSQNTALGAYQPQNGAQPQPLKPNAVTQFREERLYLVPSSTGQLRILASGQVS